MFFVFFSSPGHLHRCSGGEQKAEDLRFDKGNILRFDKGNILIEDGFCPDCGKKNKNIRGIKVIVLDIQGVGGTT